GRMEVRITRLGYLLAVDGLGGIDLLCDECGEPGPHLVGARCELEVHPRRLRDRPADEAAEGLVDEPRAGVVTADDGQRAGAPPRGAPARDVDPAHRRLGDRTGRPVPGDVETGAPH